MSFLNFIQTPTQLMFKWHVNSVSCQHQTSLKHKYVLKMFKHIWVLLNEWGRKEISSKHQHFSKTSTKYQWIYQQNINKLLTWKIASTYCQWNLKSSINKTSTHQCFVNNGINKKSMNRQYSLMLIKYLCQNIIT